MVAQTEHVDVTGPARVSIEDAIAASLAQMRELAAEAGTDDFYENWSREALDRRPLILVASVLEGYTLTWVMEPGNGPNDGVLETQVSHLSRTDASVLDLGRAEVNAIRTKCSRRSRMMSRGS
jgi:hypothetical protein